MDWNSRILVITDASLGALVACVAAKEASLAARADGAAPPPRPIAWIPAWVPESHRAAAEQIGHTYGLEVLRQSGAPGPGPRDLVESAMLVQAAYAAAHHACAGVLWPAHAGPAPDAQPDLVTISRMIDKALLVGRLCALDAEHHNVPGIRVDAPYADFSDLQIADLARDLDVRTRLCWWWEDPAGAAEKARWTAAFETLGTPIS